jgi:hypothetical protein
MILVHQCACQTIGIVFLLLFSSGCQDARPQAAAPVKFPGVELAVAFDPSAAGAIEGRVLWEGPIPEVPPFQVHTNRYPGKEPLQGLVRERPNVPIIDHGSKGVAEAVVFLRGVDLKKSRPWDHPPVQIEQRDLRLGILQGDVRVRTGFVRRGQEIAIVSRDKLYYSLHAEGADYFTFTLAEKNLPRLRRLEHRGRIELTSGAGHYWMRGDLFVDDHPYYARTDCHGRFQLAQVPAGKYQLVLWLPNWNVSRQERDPESGLLSRIFLAPPRQREKTVEVEHAGAATIDFKLSAAAFPR